MTEAAPFRLATLRQGAAVTLSRFDHPPGAKLDESEEQAAERFQINFVERGWFRLAYGSREFTLGPGSVFLSRPGEVYRYSHLPHVEADVCLSLAFSPEVAADFGSPALVPPVTNRIHFLKLQLAGDDLDSTACELVDAVADARERHLYRDSQLRWYAQRIGAAREIIDADPSGAHSIWQLSSAVAMSPFVFARIFRELVGVPPHRYLLRKRLMRARALLAAGMRVTDVCYETGFKSPSHFTRSFQRQFGSLPSAHVVKRVRS